MDVQHSIQLAAKKAGLTPHLIRAWERRYDAVSPNRTDTNRRRYSEEEIERLRLLALATRAGHRIGDIARLPTTVLREMAGALQAPASATALPSLSFSAEETLADALEAVRSMDDSLLQSILSRAAVALGQRGLLERIISPLARRVGELWAAGSMTAAHEHFVSNLLRLFLLRGSRAYAEGPNSPLLVVTTPAGQLHELGAAIVAAAAGDLGWRTLYLGPNLPAADIAHAAVSSKARAVALSIVYPGDDPDLPQELAHLRKLLPKEISIIAGGAAAMAYASALDTNEILLTDALDDLAAFLTRARMPAGG